MFKNRFLFIGITLVCSLAVAQTTFMKKLDVDFINLDNSTISTTGSNTNLTLDPAGSGKIYLAATVNNSALTASRVVVSDANKDLTSSSVTSTELGYVSGVTSAIQTQLDFLNANIGASSVNSSSIPTTDNVIVRYDSTSGRLIQSTGITVDDSNVVSGITQLNVDNLRLDGNTVSSTNTDGNIVFDPNGAGIVDAGSSTLQIGTGSSTANVIQVNHGSTPKPYLKWNNTDSTWYFSGDGSSESAFGSGSGAGINYIDNPGAESATTGWSTYADAAGSTPVNGTAGSPTVTWSRSTTTPLRDNGDFNLVKDAANRQGEGVSYDFTIDSADKGKVLNISFDYEVVSGTYADSDLTVYIYDVTNAAVIQPSGYSIQNASVVTKQIASFQTLTTSTSYRLILHVASTSASAYTLAFDNFVVGPSSIINGAPMTDEKSYTPTGNWSANYSATWARKGELAEVNLTVSLDGAPSGNMTFTSAQILNGTGLSLDTTKLAIISGNMSRALGHGTVYDSLTTSYVASAYWSQADSLIYVTTAANNIITATNPVTFASGDRVVLRLYLPIAGWSSNVQMSSDTDTRVIAAKYSLTSDNAPGAGGTMAFNEKVFDTSGSMNTSTYKYTCPVPGYYEVGGLFQSTGGASNVLVQKNDAAIADGPNTNYLCSVPTSGLAAGQTVVSCNAGDTLKIVSESAITYESDNVYVYFRRISGPSIVAATEKIQAVYKIASGVSTGTSSPIDFATKVTDTHSAVTTGASWKFTAPAAGTYLITATLAISAGTAEIRVYKNGSDGGLVLFDANATYSLSGSAQIDLVAGDYIDLRSASSVTLLNNSRYNISISRIK